MALGNHKESTFSPPAGFISDIVATLGSLFVSAVFLFFVLEGILRVGLIGDMNFNTQMWLYERQLKQPSQKAGVVHEHIPGRIAHLMGVDVSINSEGLRDREIAYEKQPGVIRILMLGDSLTFGWGVPVEKTFSKRLEKKLNQPGNEKKYEVINAGVGNYNIGMEVSYYLEEGYKYDPDIVVLNYFINDAENVPDTAPGFMARNFFAYAFLFGKTDALIRAFSETGDWKSYYQNLYEEEGLKRIGVAIKRLSDGTRKHGAKLLFSFLPELRILKDYPFTAQESTVAEIATQYGIPSAKILQYVSAEAPESLWVSIPDPHPNANANALFADGILKELLKIGFIRKNQ